MKGIDVFCASPASTAICVSSSSTTNMDQSSSIRHGGRAIDRHNPHLRDGRRRSRSNSTTTTTATTATNYLTVTSSSSSSSSQSQPQPQSQPAKKPNKPPQLHNNNSKSKTRTSSSANKQRSPPDSARYLLSDTSSFVDVLTEFEPLPSSSSSSSLVPVQQPITRSWDVKSDEYPAFRPTSSPSSSSSSSSSACINDHQVVVLRVSLHCKGCEGKVRKHLSKMKGVTSFNIDFGMKKVTVVGDVTPLGVLASISRVKNAQFWPSLSSSSSLKSTTHHHRHLNLTI